ncbi:MAG: DUF1932 domain-containing protein [Gaiellaceae bacterium]
MIVGLLPPGEMGSAVGDVLCSAGHEVLWASEGRSDATRARVVRFRDAGTAGALAAEAELIVSLCPPHAALDVARSARGSGGVYVDANAISPARAREIADVHPRFVDGGIVGPPPREAGSTRLYLSGDGAAGVASLFAGTILAAMLLAIRGVARHFGVFEALETEWHESLPQLVERLEAAERSAARKGWRWIGELEEDADTFAACGQPDGFHRAAAEVYRS